MVDFVSVADRAPVDEVIIAAATGDAVAAFYADGVLIGLELGARRSDRRTGEIILGRVARAERELDASFVDIGDGARGFLNRADAGGGGGRNRLPGEGEAILVQISREAEAAKAAKLTTNVVLPGRTLIYRPGLADRRLSGRVVAEAGRDRLAAVAQRLPNAGGGWFVRRAALAASNGSILAEAAALTGQWRQLKERAAVAKAPARLYRAPDPLLAAVAEAAGPSLERILADDPGILATIRTAMPELARACALDPVAGLRAVDAAIEAALEPSVALPGGGIVHITETPALVAIDVDVGNGRGGGAEATALATNLEAVAALAREVRLRDLAGHLVIDFVGMRQRARREMVVSALRTAFARDRQEAHVAGYTRLGKVELTRRRLRGSLRSRLCVACARCGGGGVVLSPDRAAQASLRAVLRANYETPRGGAVSVVAAPGVIAALRGPMAADVALVAKRLDRSLALREDAAMAASTFRIEMEQEPTT